MNTNSVEFFKSRNPEVTPEGSDIIIAAWKLANPENIGKIIRMAHNLAANEALFIKGSETHRQSKIKKTAGFSFEQMNWSFISETDFLKQTDDGFQICALETCDESRNIYETKLPQKTILLAGSESHGIPEEILKHCKHKIYIPMPGGCKSLNISNAISIAAFEWYRQMKYA